MQDYRLFYKDPETGDWMIQLIPIENIFMNPIVRATEFCDRLIRREPDIDKLARYYSDNKALQFLSENKGLAAGGIATIGAIYIYISEQPNRAKKAGATIKLLKQLRRFF